jgi:hypothetical protein
VYGLLSSFTSNWENFNFGRTAHGREDIVRTWQQGLTSVIKTMKIGDGDHCVGSEFLLERVYHCTVHYTLAECRHQLSNIVVVPTVSLSNKQLSILCRVEYKKGLGRRPP